MPKDVYAAIRDIVQSEGKLSDDETRAFLKVLETQKRYAVEAY